MCLKFAYTGNRGHNLWRQVELNEVNIVENGIYSDSTLAQANLVANMSLIASGGGPANAITSLTLVPAREHRRYRSVWLISSGLAGSTARREPSLTVLTLVRAATSAAPHSLIR
jgi:hypothetical protein